MLTFGVCRQLGSIRAGVINIAAFVSHYRTGEWTRYDGPPVETVSAQEVQSAFANWEPDVRAILGVSLSLILPDPQSFARYEHQHAHDDHS
jgi:hypothetical protein